MRGSNTTKNLQRTFAVALLGLLVVSCLTMLVVPATAYAPGQARTPNTPSKSNPLACGGTARPGLALVSQPNLRKLAQYDAACNGDFTDTDSFFAPTPRTTSEAAADAADVAATLKAYHRFRIHPVVFLEPAHGNDSLDLRSYAAGGYDAALSSFCLGLKQAGVTTATMGTWVLFPEGNLSTWGDPDPTLYRTNVTKTAKLLRQYFPDIQLSLMLDRQTDVSSERFVSLLPYVTGFSAGLIDSFGLQGFPSVPPAGTTGEDSVLDPSMYLSASVAAEAARALGVRQVWFNTGTFSEMYANHPRQRVSETTEQRQVLLDGVITQAQLLQHQGFEVAIHLFDEDKSASDEATNWSYWKQSPGDTPGTKALLQFTGRLRQLDIPLWLFDTYPS